MTGRTVLRTALVIVLVLLVQATIGFDITIAGVHPDVLWLLPIGAALAAGPTEGAVVGFAAGLAVDLFLPTPFGLSALIGCLLGLGIGVATRGVDRSIWWLGPVAALTGSTAAVMLYAVLGAVLGQEQFLRVDLAAVVIVVAVTNAVLAWPVNRLMHWALVAPLGQAGRTMAGARW